MGRVPVAFDRVGITAHPDVDVGRHVDQVARSRDQIGKLTGAGQRALRSG